MRNTFIVALGLGLSFACAKAPDTFTFDGHALKKATSADLADGLARVAYTADGNDEKMKSAHEVLNVVWLSDGSPQKTLDTWMKDVTAGMSSDAWLVDRSAETTACRVVRNMQSGRFVVAVTSCATVNKRSACADWEELVDMPCSVNDEPCHQPKAREICKGRIDKLSSDLEAAMKKVAR